MDDTYAEVGVHVILGKSLSEELPSVVSRKNNEHRQHLRD